MLYIIYQIISVKFMLAAVLYSTAYVQAAQMCRSGKAHMCRLHINENNILANSFSWKKLYDCKIDIQCSNFYCYTFWTSLFLFDLYLFSAALGNFYGFAMKGSSQWSPAQFSSVVLTKIPCQPLQGEIYAKETVISFKIWWGKIFSFRRHIYAVSSLMG
jgi:hypothetical protein